MLNFAPTLTMELINKYFPELEEEQKKLLTQYADLLLEWNEKINLISRKDAHEKIQQHLVHSLGITKVIWFMPATKILDVGTGGGLPGIPLAIYFPECRFTMVDSIGKKITATKDMIKQLGLTNAKAINTRAENLKEKFHFVTARGVAPSQKILSWTKKRIERESFNDLSNGYLLLKGGDLTEEAEPLHRPCSEYWLSDFFEEPFFETKKVFYFPK